MTMLLRTVNVGTLVTRNRTTLTATSAVTMGVSRPEWDHCRLAGRTWGTPRLPSLTQVGH